jgi:hypothetical protein
MRDLPLAWQDLLASPVRMPRWRVELWNVQDVNSPTLGQIIAGTATSTTHPNHYLDITGYVRDGLTLEEPGDKRAGKLSLTLIDYEGRFHPDRGQYAVFMMAGLECPRIVSTDVNGLSCKMDLWHGRGDQTPYVLS